MKALLTLLVLLTSIHTNAYSIFTLKKYNWSQIKTVDIFIAGYGKEMGLQFLYGAITRAQVHDDTYGDDRAQIILWAREKNRKHDASVLKQRGFHIMKSTNTGLTNRVIKSYLSNLNYSIKSLHMISHNAAFQGAAIETGSIVNPFPERLGHGFNWGSVKRKFAKDAFIFLHGCNTGFIVAPEISKQLERPVFGSLTSTDFQEIFQDGQWYHNNKGFGQHPEGYKREKVSGNLHNRNYGCWKGYCHRMMPNEHPYRGDFGQYNTGLNYYQAFCNYGEAGKEESCKRGVAQGILTTPTMEAKSWEDRVVDFVCPRMANPEVFNNCLKVVKGESTKRVFRGNNIQCSRKRCAYELKSNKFSGKDYGVTQIQRDFAYFMSIEPK